MSFKIGSKVKLKERLKHSPNDMIVEKIEDEEITVFWFGEVGDKQQATFNKTLLELYTEDDEEVVSGFFNQDPDLEDIDNGSPYRF
ncbi:hypothetical protein Q6A87_08580 [Aliarcobacter skirrowii]|uniref:hypothetical protein n=1 Tax=Aliarcobacter TaxID=2321111 RepID=UPI0021B6789F|nr:MULTISPECIES: hypothetical protein [Aliarcobacter]MCT7509272.1 hypothetical protein [Aliarcobacter cryaerophilus]MDX4067903.1 hypothetical protein [Aliarcobacter skirrowii]